MPLTDTAIQKKHRAGEKPYKAFDGGGLHLLVTPDGARYWRLDYRYNGKRKTLAIGVYPVVSLSLARERRDAAKKLLAAGTDPAQAKRERKRAERLSAANTFE